MNYDPQRALELLRRGVGRDDAAFREGQEEADRWRRPRISQALRVVPERALQGKGCREAAVCGGMKSMLK